jgi:hypothetical protein
MFNIKSANLSLNETAIVHLEDPRTGMLLYADEAETQPLTIEVYGRTSKIFRNWAASENRKTSALERAGKKEKTKTPEEMQENVAEMYATLTKKVSNFDMNGVALDNHEAYKALYNDLSLSWITEQVASVMGQTEAFLQQ